MKKKKLLEMFMSLEREVAELKTALSKKDDEIIKLKKDIETIKRSMGFDKKYLDPIQKPSKIDPYVIEFINTMCYVDVNDFGLFTPTDELFSAYKEFRKRDGREIVDDEKIGFSKLIRVYTGCEPKKKRHPLYSNPMNGYRGIKLNKSSCEERNKSYEEKET